MAMIEIDTDNKEFYASLLNCLKQGVAVLDENGFILYINESWVHYCQENGLDYQGDCGVGVNYLTVIEFSRKTGKEFAATATKALKAVFEGKSKGACLEYSCHSPEQKRWLSMRVAPIPKQVTDDAKLFLLTHTDVTERKLAEERERLLNIRDGLTGVFNRKRFLEFLQDEWRRGIRTQTPVSLLIVDIDYFKAFNEEYGQQAGDEALIKVSEVLRTYIRRPSDMIARFGGDQFAVVMAHTLIEPASEIAEHIVNAVRELKIENKNSEVNDYLTISVGLAMSYPNRETYETVLIKSAEEAMMESKKSGHDKVSISRPGIFRGTSGVVTYLA